ncbi:MAG: hypothetical protein OEL81_04255 [Nitrosopumilus sp.]|nr:hypothetical protein [Nitrosopumilus sp.]
MNPEQVKISQRDSGYTLGCAFCTNPVFHTKFKAILQNHIEEVHPKNV